jgi:hypothetical protein
MKPEATRLYHARNGVCAKIVLPPLPWPGLTRPSSKQLMLQHFSLNSRVKRGYDCAIFHTLLPWDCNLQ